MSILDFRRNPEVVARDFASSFDRSITSESKWHIDSTNSDFPGVTLHLSAKATDGTVFVELRNFLGIGWLAWSYEIKPDESLNSNANHSTLGAKEK